jgi:hypothetical protein
VSHAPEISFTGMKKRNVVELFIVDFDKVDIVTASMATGKSIQPRRIKF